jgi:GT2 family glycosyltransferase
VVADSVTVLVVSYRRADQLADALSSVRHHLPDATVRVWDNGSDGSAKVRDLASRLPGVRWTFSAENIGFAAAVNQLMADSHEPFVLLLNPDAVLTGDMSGCLQLMRSAPRLAACAPWLDAGPRHRPWDNAHREPTVVRQVCSYAGWAPRLRRHRALSDLYAEQPDVVEGYLTGACLWIRRSAWAQVGPFDETFFLYAEEADWARRARRHGWQLRAVAEPGARHRAGGTVRDSRIVTRSSADLLLRSQVRYLRKHSGAGSATAYRWATWVLDRVQRSKRARS